MHPLLICMKFIRMKKLSFIGLLIALLFTAGCKKEDDLDNDDEDITGTPVMILGEVDMAATQAAKVLALSSTDRYKIADITNNRFSIELDNGKPWGLIFLNSAEQPLGFLSLGNGIETLPLHYITTGVDSIDLQTITRNGNIFIPSHNPVGNEIPLTADQKDAVAGTDDYLAMLLKNPDVNGNGQVDALEGKFFSLKVIFFIKPGNFHSANLTPTYDPYNLIEGYKLFLSVEDNSFPETIYYTGPAGSPLSGTPSEGYLSFTSHRVYSTPYQFNVMDTSSYIPVAGVYTIQYNGQTLTFNLPDQSYALSNVVYPWPALTLNGDGTMNKLDWSYQTPSGTTGFDLSAIMRNISLSVEGTGNKCTDHQNSDRLYDTGRLPISTTSHTFSCQNIDWGAGTMYPGWKHVDRLMFGYEDHYDATYVVMYERSY